MKNFKKFINTAIVVTFFVGALSVTGCSGVSAEELAQLDALRAEVKTLEKEVNSLKSEKAKLEKDIADREAKLDQCNKEKEIAKKNLEKIGK